MSSFERLFDPRGIAVVGASADASRAGGQTVHALARMGYAGRVYPVNPKYDAIAGYPCLPSVDAIDGPCDVAVVALPASAVPDAIAACGRKGIRYGVVLGGGFREAGPDGVAREQAMIASARAHGMRLIGPNCLGLVNVTQRAYAGFGSLVRPPMLAPGGVSAALQSGGFGNSLVIRAAMAGVGFRYVVMTGNEADITMPELIEAFVDDPGTRAIMIYMEGVNDGRAFMRAARRALAAGKPIIAWKAGNTRQGMRAATSHTANLATGYDVFRAAFRQTGVIEATDVEEAGDYALCLQSGRMPGGRGVAVLGGSGGSAVVFSDAADVHGLELAKPTEATMEVLRRNLPDIAALDNPIDYAAGFLNDANADRFHRACDAILADPNIHMLGHMMATVGHRAGHVGAIALADLVERHRKPVLAFCCMPHEEAKEAYETLAAVQIPVMTSPARVARACGMLAGWAETVRDRDALLADADAPASASVPAAPEGSGPLDERRSKEVLAACGIPVTRDLVLAADGPPPAEPLGLAWPLAVKVLSADIAHKTDVGGVRLGIGGRDALQAAIAEVVGNARRARPDARIDGVLVAEMVPDGVETIVGAVNDPVFGPVVAFGLGGIHAEVLRDITYRIAPFGLATARTMIGELRSAALLGGVRGRPPCDVEALARLLSRLSEVVWAWRDRLAELDLNPVFVRPSGHGAVAADALVVLR